MCISTGKARRSFLLALMLVTLVSGFVTQRLSSKQPWTGGVSSDEQVHSWPWSMATVRRQISSPHGPDPHCFGSNTSDQDASFYFKREQRKEWLRQASDRLVTSPVGSLDRGKWHEIVSILTAWSRFVKQDPDAPLRMEALLKRLVEEPTAHVCIDIYNKLLDAWACAALFKTHPAAKASQRAREILVSLQEIYDMNKILQPNRESFDVVYHVVCRTEAPVVGRRLLALREYLYKTGKNLNAKASIEDYTLLMNSYANYGGRNAGLHASGLLSHMRVVGVLPNLRCYNLVIKAWTRAQKGRTAAEQAERILEEMAIDPFVEPDLVTYSSVISAWAASGMNALAVTRVENLLEKIEEKMQPNTIVMNAVMSTWVKSRSPNSVDRIQEILRRMENSRDENMRPDIISYNTYIHALSMHSRRRPHYAKLALKLLKNLEQGNETGKYSFRPNSFTYNFVIDSFCESREPKYAALVLGRMIQSRVEPNTFSFNKVLLALAKSSMQGACEMAEGLLQYMDEMHQKGLLPRASPDLLSYSSLLFGYSRNANAENARKGDCVLNELKKRSQLGETHLKPNRICYNSLIDCWAKSGQGTLGARKAEELLQEMQDLCQAGDMRMAPDVITYNAVLNAWARSGTRCCAVQAEKYLNRMWELYYSGEAKLKPNDFSYNTVINAVSKSRNEGKAQKALRLLRKMDKLYRAGDKDTRPNQVTYTAVLNSCAFPVSNDPKVRRKTLDTAIFTLTELQGSGYGHPNQITYVTFIKAVSHLLDEDDELRRDIIERAFRQCCDDGQVGEMVLSYLRKAAPVDLYKKLLSNIIQSSGATISVKDLPEHWKANVRDELQQKRPWKHNRISSKPVKE